MNDPYDELPFQIGEPTPATPTGVRPRPHRHRWLTTVIPPSTDLVTQCAYCPAIRDEVAARRGKQSRKYGNGAELDVARKYGGRKVGHHGGKADVIGRGRKVQVKTSRRAVPPMWRAAFDGLDTIRDGRLAILLLRFVRMGGAGPDDYMVVRARDFIAWYGSDPEEGEEQ